MGYKFRPIRSGTTHGTSDLPHELVTSRETRMKLHLSLLALAGTLIFLIVFLMDREREAGIERLTHWRAPHSEANDGAHLRAA